MKLLRLLRLLPWITLIFIGYATLSSIGARPHLFAAANLERFVAFALLGCLFAAAYPRRVVSILVSIIAVAAGLELVQWLEPDRHARLADFLVKAAGGICGGVAIWLPEWLLPRFGKFLEQDRPPRQSERPL